MPFYRGHNCKVEVKRLKKGSWFKRLVELKDKILMPIKENEMIPPWYGLVVYRFGFEARYTGFIAPLGLNVIFRFIYDIYTYIRVGSAAVPPSARAAYMQGRDDERRHLEKQGRLKP